MNGTLARPKPLNPTKALQLIGALFFAYLFFGFMLLPCLNTLTSIFTTKDAAGRTDPFDICGPPGLRRVIEGLRVIAPQLPYRVELHELPFGEAAFDICGMRAACFALDHGMPCLGYRFDLPRPPKFDAEKARELDVPVTFWGRLQRGETVELADGRVMRPEDVMGPPRKGLSFVYATDTRPVEAIARMGQGTNLMFLEGMYGEEEKLPQAIQNKVEYFREQNTSLNQSKEYATMRHDSDANRHKRNVGVRQKQPVEQRRHRRGAAARGHPGEIRGNGEERRLRSIGGTLLAHLA